MKNKGSKIITKVAKSLLSTQGVQTNVTNHKLSAPTPTPPRKKVPSRYKATDKTNGMSVGK